MSKPINIRVTNRAGVATHISASAGQTLLEALQHAGFDELSAQCGGNCSCATCHVYLESFSTGAINAQSIDEDELLDGTYSRTAASRLSCQVVLEDGLDGLLVQIAPD